MMIVAEISGEHCGKLSCARDLIAAAQMAGADAVKLQCFEPEKLAARRGGGLCKVPPWEGKELIDLYRQTHTPREWFPQLFEYADKIGIECFSSVYDPDGVDFLETLDCPMYKIASYESNDEHLIDHAASTGKPLIISAPWRPRPKNALFLYCVSEYPTPPEHVHLHRMVEQDCDGFSDHTEGITAAIAAAALGARIIEKHITFSRADGGPDASFAIEPAEFLLMTRKVHEVCAMCYNE